MQKSQPPRVLLLGLAEAEDSEHGFPRKVCKIGALLFWSPYIASTAIFGSVLGGPDVWKPSCMEARSRFGYEGMIRQLMDQHFSSRDLDSEFNMAGF